MTAKLSPLDVPVAEIAGRISQFQASLREASVDGVLLMQRADLLYFTGAVHSGAMLVPARGEPVAMVWRGLQRLAADPPFEVVPIGSIGRLSEAAAGRARDWRRVGLELDVLPVAAFQSVAQPAFPAAEFIDVSPLIRDQRAVKSDYELEMIRRAGGILAQAVESLKEVLRVGMTEREAHDHYINEVHRAGGSVFMRVRAFNAEAGGVVVAGASAGLPTAFDGPIPQPGMSPASPVGSGANPIPRDVPIMADVVATYAGYHADMTRIFVAGRLPSRFRRAHEFIRELHAGLIERMQPGAMPSELYLRALNRAEAAGFSELFMNRGTNRVKFIGHGVGLELDELPILARRYDKPLKAGMTIALEPKIVFDNGAVGLEDTVIVTESGPEVTTKMDTDIVTLA